MKRFALLLLVVSLSAGAQPRREPVPPQFLRGHSLVVLAGNFSIDAPDPSWQWELLRPSQPDPSSLGTYVCLNPTDGAYFVVTVHSFKATRVDATFLDGFLTEARSIGPDVAASLQHQTVDTPLQGSVRYRYAQAPASGRVQHTYGYIVATGRAVTIFTLSASDQEPPGLKAFAGSLRLLRPHPSAA